MDRTETHPDDSELHELAERLDRIVTDLEAIDQDVMRTVRHDGETPLLGPDELDILTLRMKNARSATRIELDQRAKERRER